MIDIKDIYDRSNKGLDIILYYYPQAQECVYKKNEKFKIRDEATASCSIKEYSDCWKIADWGDDGRARSPLDIAMMEEGLNFSQALYKWADRLGIQKVFCGDKFKAKIKRDEVSSDVELGTVVFPKDNLTDFELKVWGKLIKENHLKEYGYSSLAYYTTTKEVKDEKTGVIKRFTTRTESTDDYPIFCRDCGEFKKIYQPLNQDKAFRFFYVGKKTQGYINGLSELKKCWNDFNSRERKVWESDPMNENKPYRDKKINEAIICSGERDAITAWGFGYRPLWMNSETEQLQPDQYAEIMKMVDKLYNIPDIDETGVRKGIELGLKYLDIYTVRLPESLRNYKDMRGKPRKDLRDYIELYPNKWDFESLLRVATPYKFWDKQQNERGKWMTEIISMYLLMFLRDSGFYRTKDKANKREFFVKLTENIASEVDALNIRSYLLDFAINKVSDIQVANLILNSKRTASSTLNDLKEIEIKTIKHTDNSQWFYFKNTPIEVTSNEVKKHNYKSLKSCVWENQIVQHNFTRLKPCFDVIFKDNDINQIDFDIKNYDSHLFRYLINGSRIHWRKELEELESDDLEENRLYNERQKFAIIGSRLSLEENEEQIKNLVSKIYSIGYILHSYKVYSNPYLLWIMEDKISEDGESSGGSGKSLFMKAIASLKNTLTIDSSPEDVFKNAHLFENVTEQTEIIQFDDLGQYADFRFLYNKITLGITVNPKHKGSQQLDFESSAKMVVTSNFSPRSTDASTMRRLIFMVFSDYYHKQTDENDYRETRSIHDSFGYDLWNKKYKSEWWNEDFNFLIDCLQFYLKCMEISNEPITPPMDRVKKRINISRMGNNFEEWADVYFNVEGDNVNREIIRSTAFTDFVVSTGTRNWTRKKFGEALKAYCKNSESIENLNPLELSTKGRIIRKINKKTVEMIYVQTCGTQVNYHTHTQIDYI